MAGSQSTQLVLESRLGNYNMLIKYPMKKSPKKSVLPVKWGYEWGLSHHVRESDGVRYIDLLLKAAKTEGAAKLNNMELEFEVSLTFGLCKHQAYRCAGSRSLSQPSALLPLASLSEQHLWPYKKHRFGESAERKTNRRYDLRVTIRPVHKLNSNGLGGDKLSAQLYASVWKAPVGQQSTRDRILLLCTDQLLYAHAAVLCAASPVLTTYYHGCYDNNGAAEKPRPFSLDFPSSVVGALLEHIYLKTNLSNQSPSLLVDVVRLAHFLGIDDFGKALATAVTDYKRKRTHYLRASEAAELGRVCLQLDYSEAFIKLISCVKCDCYRLSVSTN